MKKTTHKEKPRPKCLHYKILQHIQRRNNTKSHWNAARACTTYSEVVCVSTRVPVPGVALQLYPQTLTQKDSKPSYSRLAGPGCHSRSRQGTALPGNWLWDSPRTPLYPRWEGAVTRQRCPKGNKFYFNLGTGDSQTLLQHSPQTSLPDLVLSISSPTLFICILWSSGKQVFPWALSTLGD